MAPFTAGSVTWCVPLHNPRGVGGGGKQSWSKIFRCRPTYLFQGRGNPVVILPRVMKVGPMMYLLVELYLHTSQTIIIIATVLSYNVGLALTVIDILKGIL